MKEISIKQAEAELVKRVAKMSIEDAVYELAFDTVQKCIMDVESDFHVVDGDGLLCTSDSGQSELWYDDMREIMMQEVYAKAADFLKGFYSPDKKSTRVPTFQILSLATRKQIVDDPVDAYSFADMLPDLVRKNGGLIVLPETL